MKATIELSDRKRARHFTIDRVTDLAEIIPSIVGERFHSMREESRTSDSRIYEVLTTDGKNIRAYVGLEEVEE